VIRVAIIEDDPTTRARLVRAIDATEDIRVCAQAANVAEGLGVIEAGGYEVMLCDLGLPDGSGVTLISEEAKRGRDTDILVITLFAEQRKVLDTIRAGARGYLLKDESDQNCVEAIREIRRGGSPISPIIARQLLSQIRPDNQTLKLGPVSPLSERELEVLNLLSRGFSYTECGEILHVTTNTIGTHVKNIYRKLEVNSRAEALFEASSMGLLGRDQAD
jgi:DNA-binding NarL/FixJ family response regulator